MKYYRLFNGGGREIAAAYLIDDHEAADFAKFICDTRHEPSPVVIARYDKQSPCIGCSSGFFVWSY